MKGPGRSSDSKDYPELTDAEWRIMKAFFFLDNLRLFGARCDRSSERRLKTMNYTTITENDKTRAAVRESYGKIAREDDSCCSNTSCCGEGAASCKAEELGYTLEDLNALPQGAEMTLGCGNPTAIAQLKRGETVLDLGSGGGFDCFIAAKQVGDTGRVIGVDMTPDMISKARNNALRGNYAQVEFRLGEIEALPVADETVDAIMSNCVINLSPDKSAVFREAYRVLKPGGRLSIADIVAKKQIPDELRKDMEVYSSCMSGSALVGDLKRLIEETGFSEVSITFLEASQTATSEAAENGGNEELVGAALIEAKK